MPDMPTPPDVTVEILSGLTARQKTLPAKLFYDEAGCALFERITRLPEYYVTRAENALLARHAGEIAEKAPIGAALVEYGAADESKAVSLLDAGTRAFTAYAPVDIAPGALAAIVARMRISHPAIPVLPLVADFLQPLSLPASFSDKAAFGFFPGSTIGNFRPEAVHRFLGHVRDTLSGQAAPMLVVGTDLRKDESVLVPAYDDAEGVTAQFNLNILSHVNAIAGADFDLAGFRHRALWNAHEGRMEMHLESLSAQTVTVSGTRIAFRRGETIHTEDSYKHTREGFLALAQGAGWRSGGFWTDPDGLFGMHLLLG
ncbi:L-histidine N(alpha)-methyltransferase [Acetobacteraceae bacterium KSS8]|uniref:L-histidine N(Alpha)-methyltransferase n=1 Tax=Endosaccharibacter trunci TaxID=2812733 RepID=A0ABT1W5Y1_9PROT|nr:L-histidine N(alpha)-methyltransferase [Acetobacteraceae bacterium KSS8]